MNEVSSKLVEWEVIQRECHKLYAPGMIDNDEGRFDDWMAILDEIFYASTLDEWCDACLEYHDEFMKWHHEWGEREKMKAFQKIMDEVDECYESEHRMHFEKWLHIHHEKEADDLFNQFQIASLAKNSTWRDIFPKYTDQMKKWQQEFANQDGDAAIASHLSYLKKNLIRI